MLFPSMELGQVYFYTATILKWQPLLAQDKYKEIIIESLNYLSKKQKIAVYAFVLMPNHIHLIWEMLAKNGKEMPHASFMKYTAHQFLEDLRLHHQKVLPYFEVEGKADRQHQFWERNSLPIVLYSPAVFEQKLQYIHHNPIAKKWALVEDYVDYRYSSAKFYELGIDEFGFLQDYRERI
ncbi:transposase [Hugenholtzia roseola]|uniref:transposase n=1 Tax=Hugenholtzia roseola TaxID=1002 RepID=UPI001FE1A244|nr:transposase [Hugenholtzia roseola]